MPEKIPTQPADHLGIHPLAERFVIPLMLSDMKVTVEGTNVHGKPVRLTLLQVEPAQPTHCSLLEVIPLEREDDYLKPLGPNDDYLKPLGPNEHYLVLNGKLVPDSEGAVYHVEEL